MSGRDLRRLYWLPAPVLAVTLYWQGLGAWFLQDDFVWLGLHRRVYDFASLLRAVFAPTEHGTFRPISERAFFLAFERLFGWDALPFRIAVLLTFCAALVLLALVVRRVTGSRLAAAAAGAIWTVNGCMSIVMTWTSAYMQVLCAFFILLAFYFLLRHIETGQARYYAAQLAVFVVGFGVMETNLMYAFIAALYTWLFARAYFRRTLPLVALSGVFVALHMSLAPKAAAGPYAVQLGFAVFTKFARYWEWAVLPPEASDAVSLDPFAIGALVIVITAALAAFAIAETWRRRFVALFLLALFAMLLAPVLPVGTSAGHYYYLTLPMMGLAAFGGHAFASAWRARLPWRVVGTALLAVYVAVSAPTAYSVTVDRVEVTQRARNIVEGVARARRLYPKAAILLDGVDHRLFWEAIFDRPFLSLGIDRVYLTPGSDRFIQKRVATENLKPFCWSKPLLPELAAGKAIVLDVQQNLRNVTADWHRGAMAAGASGRVVNAGHPAFASSLGGGWHGRESEYRWTMRRASVWMAAPSEPGRKLQLSGHCTGRRDGPVAVSISAAGRHLGTRPVEPCAGGFTVTYDLPETLLNRGRIEVVVEVNHTVKTDSDPRELGLIFGTFEIR